MKKIIILTAIIFLVFTGLSFAAQKTITKYMRAGDMGAHMPLNPGDFVPNPSDPRALTGNLVDNNLSMGNNINDTSGSYIYGGDSDLAYCVAGNCIFGIGLRAYFEFTFQVEDKSSDSTAQADGFTFTVFNGSNNTKNSTGGAPAGISMGELIGYAGPGRTDGSGLQPPKMAIEFDTFPNTGSTDICAANSRNDADNNNHMALMFWGDDLTGNCTISGTNYPKTTFDDNRHGAGTVDNPVNSSKGDGLGGYFAGAKGTCKSGGTCNWLEDNQLHRFRLEIIRATTPVSGKYPYNIKAWVDCAGCTADQLKTFKDLTVPYDNESLSPKRINRTVSLTAADHQAFNTMLFGWTFATGGSTETVGFQNFDIYFPRSPCGYGTNPASASLSSAAQSGNINVLATAGCTWTATRDSSSWLTLASCSNGGTCTGGTSCGATGNATVTYNVSANNCPSQRTGLITIGDQVFTVTQAGGSSPLSINTASLPTGRMGISYSTTVAASGGVTPYTWSQSGLTAGLGINASTGVISGTPTANGWFTPTVTVTDSCPQTANANYSLGIKDNNYTITNNTGATIYRQSGGTCTTTNRITNGSTYSIAYNAAAVTFYSSRSGTNACQGTSISISGASADAADVNYSGNVQINSAWSLVDN